MDLKREQEKHQRMQEGVWILWDELNRIRLRSTLARVVRNTAQALEDELRRSKGYLPDHDLTRDERESISKRTIAKVGIVEVQTRAAVDEPWQSHVEFATEESLLSWVDMEHIFIRVSNLMANEANFEMQNLEVIRKNS